jgi:hypothetical protein
MSSSLGFHTTHHVPTRVITVPPAVSAVHASQRRAAWLLAMVPAYWVTLYFGLYVLTNLHRPPRILYMSDLLNSGDDTPLLFTGRWAAWVGYLATVGVVLRRVVVGRRAVVAWIAAVALCIVSGVQPRVFSPSASTPEWLKWAHYVCSGVVLFVAAYVLRAGGWPRVALAWFLLAVAYCVLFVLRDEVGVEGAVFAVSESVAFWLLHAAWATRAWTSSLRVVEGSAFVTAGARG